MKIAVYHWKKRPFSIAVYTEAVTSWLRKMGVELIEFSDLDPLPDEVELYWDPGTGRPAPYHRLKNVRTPLVVTYHGAANLSLSLRDCHGPRPLKLLSSAVRRWITRQGWRSFSSRDFYAVAVSEYARQEAVSCLGLNPDNIRAVYHGIDTSSFAPNPDWSSREDRYFLHVSQYQPKKNVDAIIEAYRQLRLDGKPELVVVSPGYRAKASPPGVKLVTTAKSTDELADLYRNATAFVFPSLHETFGMPILEAMACGCPVITSNVTACPEVAGDAALLVDPRSVSDLTGAMRCLAEDASLRADLRERGLRRASLFTWQRSAEQHLKIFEQVLQKSKRK